MGSSARHLEDYDSPTFVGEMKVRNLKDYKRWQTEIKVLQGAITEVRSSRVLKHKSTILESLKKSLDSKEKWVSEQVRHWHYYGVCPDEVC